MEEVDGFEPSACFTSQHYGPLPEKPFKTFARELPLYQLSYTSCFCSGWTLTINLLTTNQDSSHLSYTAY